MDKDKLIKVMSRNSGIVFYVIPELNGLKRVFQPGEVKEIPFDELRKLSYLPGGMSLLQNNLVIQDDEAVATLLGQVEPEYNYTVEDIKRILQVGTLDEFLDCLDFAPDGVKEIIKTMAVDIELNDVSKREAILDKLNFDVTNAINIKRETQENDVTTKQKPTRRATQKEESGIESQPKKIVRRVSK